MTVVVREKKTSSGKIVVDIRLRLPTGKVYRERRHSPINTRTGAKEWGKQRELALWEEYTNPTKQAERALGPILNEYWPWFLRDCEARRQKPSSIENKTNNYNKWLAPRFGKLKLGQLTNKMIADLKADMIKKAPSTVNNVLGMLSSGLKRAVEIGHIETLPCTIKMMKRRKAHRGFYPPDSIDRLRAVGNVKEEAVILLGGHAGMRAGEIAGLKRSDLDFTNGMIHLERALWKGIEVAPKNGRGRKIPMTETLKAALLALPLEGGHVLYQDNGRRHNARTLATIVRRLERKAGLPEIGHVHLLRHSFCSNLGASEQVPVRTIMELAGHANLDTTLGYMKLAEHAARLAIRVLDGNGSRQASVPPAQLN